MNRRIIASAAVGLLSLVGSAGASSIFFDGVFNPSDWSANLITNPGGAGSTMSASQNLTGGNPNEWREVKHTLVVSGLGEMIGFHMNALSFYTPSSQGAISSIIYSEDSINLISDLIVPGNGQGTGMAILQGGKYYGLRPGGVMPFATHSTWQAFSDPAVLATDMWEYSASGGLNPLSNPDFSITGGLMQFGFWRGNSGFGGYSTDCGIDNWYVEIVPAPGAAALLGLGFAAAGRRRRPAG